MIRNYPNELWKEIKFDETKYNPNAIYFVSNYGRVIKDKEGKKELGKIGVLNGYPTISVKQKSEKRRWTNVYLHKIVAETFLEKDEDHKYVIHLNYDKLDNKVSNLKWATKREKEIHQFTNPEYKNREKFIPYSKLTEGRVRLIKRKIFDPNRKTRMKMIAKQFGVSTMQLYRIKSGENWGHVTDF